MFEIKNIIFQLVAEPFTWGLLIGLVLAFTALREHHHKSRSLRAELRKARAELHSTQDHLNRQLKIEARDLEHVEREIREFKKRIEQIQEQIAQLRERPAGEDRRMLLTYRRAVSLMSQKTPGFGQAWERIRREVEAEIEAAQPPGAGTRFKRFVQALPSSAVNALPFFNSAEPEGTPSKSDPEASRRSGRGKSSGGGA